MIFTKYNTAADFSADTLKHLKKYEIQNNILIKNIGDGEGKTMLTVKDDDGNILFIAICTSPFPMVMFEIDNIRNDEVVKFFAKSAIEYGIDINFIMTEKALSKSFTKCYGELTKKAFVKNESLVLYTIDKVKYVPKTNGHLRAATETDMYYIPYWIADFQPACNIGEYNLAAGIEGAEKTIKYNALFIWEDDFPVSMAAAVREVTDCRFIGYVYTLPHFRCKGYSTACVSMLTQKLLDDGYKNVALYSDCDNPYSNAVYRKIGYKETFWYDQYKVME